MRVIKFRGKRKDNGEWVVGSLSIEFDNTHRISLWVNTLIEPENNYWESVNEIYEVIPESVGQYTGRHDINGIEIFEGDIVKHGESIRFIEQRGSNYLATRMEKTETILLSFCERPIVIGNLSDNPALNPPKEGVLNMTTDPKEGQEEVKGDQAAEAQQEQAAEESVEEGNTEG